MADTSEKARALRLQRLSTMLDVKLEHPAAALDVLIRELEQEHVEPSLWERFHAAALRDGQEQGVAAAYRAVAVKHRLQQLPAAAAGALLVHAADFFQGVLGDMDTSVTLLHSVLERVPGHPEAFARLERRFLEPRDNLKLLDIYGLVAAKPPVSADHLAHSVVNAIGALPTRSPLPDETCRRLIALVSAGGIGVLDALWGHCKKTDRPLLACELGEHVLAHVELTKQGALALRRDLAELYTTDAGEPDKAITHVELLLAHDATDTRVRAAASRLLSSRTVGVRAASALREARRTTRVPGPPDE
jgi:hypothetical protein